MNDAGALDRLRRQVLARLKEKGARQNALAAHLGISSGGLSMMLRGKRGISIELLDQIGAFFGVPASVLLVDLDPETARIPSLEVPAGGGGISHAETRFLARSAEIDRLRILIARQQHIIQQQREVLGHIAGQAVDAVSQIDRIEDAIATLEPAGAARGGAGQHARTTSVAKRRRPRSGRHR